MPRKVEYSRYGPCEKCGAKAGYRCINTSFTRKIVYMVEVHKGRKVVVRK